VKPDLAERIATGDALALARAISLVEDGLPEGEAILAALFSRTGRADVIGVTGPPGAGKSTLVSRLIGQYRGAGRQVGVVAVDPSSAFSGGAILGDRIRMQDHTLDAGVFIRSMASRGRFGGLSRATRDAVDLIDASGRDPVFIETVGVGQDEVEVVRAADTVLVVLTPGQGDDIQAIKAGLLEIADVFVINKADHAGTDRLAADLEGMLSLGEPRPWRPPVVRTTAHEGGGLEALAGALAAHRSWLDVTDARATRRRDGMRARLLDILRERALAPLLSEGPGGADLEAWEERLAARAVDPYGAARALLERHAPGQPVLDHVGVAVRRLDDRLPLWRDLLGLPLAGVEEVPGEGVRVAFLPAGRARVELVEPSGQDSPMARQIERRGEGIHHLCLEVPDLDAAIGRLRAAGVALAGEGGRSGAEGAKVAFLHPRGTGGVLVELRSRGTAPRPPGD
jgi:LAO/AO transport system kinase